MSTHGIRSDRIRVDEVISSNYPIIEVLHSTGKFLAKQGVRLIDGRKHSKMLGYRTALLIDCTHQE
jgi:hypothetical protein